MQRHKIPFRERLNSSAPLLLDGAMGTELERRGYRTTLPYWSAFAADQAPELLLEIHTDYVKAGADIITANTFRTTGYTLAKGGKGDLADQLTRRSLEIAREASMTTERDIYIAVSMAPLEDCYSPDLVPSQEVIKAAYEAQVRIIHDCQPDLVLMETMINADEVVIGAELLTALGIPFGVSFTLDANGDLLDGTPLPDIVERIAHCNSDLVLLNCRKPEQLSAQYSLLKSVYKGPTGLYANGEGMPGGTSGWLWKYSESAVNEYVSEAECWLELGARVIGGCCGTRPEYISSLRRVIDAREALRR